MENNIEAKDYFKLPTESLNTELKAWLDPDLREHQIKIIKACISLYNHNGGFLYIGYDNNGEIQKCEFSDKILEKYHIDPIQKLISTYSTIPFEVKIYFNKKDGADEIQSLVIAAPGGVKKPAFASRVLQGERGGLLKKETIYVRSLNANGIPSTTEIKLNDWDSLIERCLENREADIGKFISRHLTPEQFKILQDFFILASRNSSMIKQSSFYTEPEQKAQIIDSKVLNEILKNSFENLNYEIQKRKLNHLPNAYWEVAFIYDEKIQIEGQNYSFLNLMKSCNPRYTGWPLWVVLLNTTDKSKQPYFDAESNSWRACIVNGDEIDFWTAFSSGTFYHFRTLEDDGPFQKNESLKGKVLEFSIPIVRVAEAIAISIEYAKNFFPNREEGKIYFAFRWTGLNSRMLSSWASPDAVFSGFDSAYRDSITSFIEVPFNASKETFPTYIAKVLAPLYEAFGGAKISNSVIQDITGKFLNRR